MDPNKLKFNTNLYIGGKFVKSKKGQTFDVINPADQTVLASVQRAGQQDVDQAVKCARQALQKGPWATMDPHDRGKCIYKLADLIQKNLQELAAIQAVNNGKPWAIAKIGDLVLCHKTMRYFAGWPDKIKGHTHPVDGPFFAYTKKQPVGVVGQIIPWNVPLIMLCWKLAPALAAGCTIVLKTSQQTPLSAMRVAQLINQAGIPAGVVNILNGFGDTGAYISKHPGIDKVAFTGSKEVGYKIMKGSHEKNLKRVTLQLGGKSPNIITKNANLQTALSQSTFALYLNGGQSCIAGSGTFVHQSIYDQFCSKIVKCVSNIKVGNPLDPDTNQGPLNNKQIFERVLGYIEKGKSQGAKLLLGGKRYGDKGFFIEPTVFCDVTDDMTIAKQEIFGPVMCIFKFSSNEEVVKRANNTEFGLGAGIVSQNAKQIQYFVDKIRAGTVFVNCYNVFNSLTPFGGFKDSGIGREMGEQGLNSYLETKSVIMQK